MSRVLIVIDDTRDRDRVHAALSIEGNELIDHQDSGSAAERAATELVDVAVVDLRVGSMGGMAVAREFRAHDERIPVVLLLDRQADTFLAGRSGASAWVTKPFTAAALRAAVTTATRSGVADPPGSNPDSENQ
ncbi:MAG: hypothetical protein BMS9Abin07_1094 [Acidimicrobiia bacterium]|nr:MAG: hypothetical protein BMS9Abin07_1094 [Acidimicrobiia bacterium]